MKNLIRGYPLRRKIFTGKKIKEFLADDKEIKMIIVRSDLRRKMEYNSVNLLADDIYYQILFDRRIFIELEEVVIFQ